MHDTRSEQQHKYPLLVGRIPVKFSPVYNEIKVSCTCINFIFKFNDSYYQNSWGTMVTLPSQNISIVKETSLMTFCPILLGLMSTQGSIKYLKSMGMILKLP